LISKRKGALRPLPFPGCPGLLRGFFGSLLGGVGGVVHSLGGRGGSGINRLASSWALSIIWAALSLAASIVEAAFSSTLLPQAAKMAATVANMANFLIILVVCLVKVGANVAGSGSFGKILFRSRLICTFVRQTC
jgi:hypothetical protein